MRTGTILLAVLTMFLSWSCERFLDEPTAGLEISDWATISYTVEQNVICFCAGPAGSFHKLKVVNDEIVEVDDRAPKPEELTLFRTIGWLLEWVESIDPDSVAVLRVTYDGVYGYPTDLYVDQSAFIIDEEVGYQNKNLTILNN